MADDTTQSAQKASPWLTYRRVFIVLVHAALWGLATLIAYLLRFEFQPPARFLRIAAETVPVLIGLRLVCFWQQRLFHGLWRYTGSKDLGGILIATTAATLFFVLYCTLAGFRGVPRSVFVIEWSLALLLIGGTRFGIRKLRELSLQVQSSGDRKNVLIIGAGDAGEALLRELTKTYARRYQAVGLVDDNAAKHGTDIHGVKVLGPVDAVPEIVKRLEVEEVIIAIPTASGRQMRRIIEICKPACVQLRIIPGIDRLIDGHVRITHLRDVAIEDLLGRDPVELDIEVLDKHLSKRVVMVTGAGGSIGAELCRQVARFGPSTLVMVEQAEPALFEIQQELARTFPELTTVPAVCDVVDRARVAALFDALRPNIVFHAAAHKHVPMMEANPGEALKNNVFGTCAVADIAHEFEAERFVMVSTDKAVNPTSIMGATKRVAELYIQDLDRHSETRFLTVRFGNVLGSSGSVIPIFREQIRRGGPVTVTHPDMTRYFMTIPEASQLVIQAALLGDGGEIFILDMGEPVKIVDLARDLIALSGFTPGDDIEIAFTGVRPGEKLFEELNLDGEDVEKTRYAKIFVGKSMQTQHDLVRKSIAGLKVFVDGKDRAAIRAALRKIVPEYQPNGRTDVDEVPTASPRKREAADVIPLRR